MVVNVDVNVAKDQIAGMLAKTEAGAGVECGSLHPAVREPLVDEA
jgi:hypothetical protein